MRMKIDVINYEEFPDNMRLTLVPDMLVPVPDCDASVQTDEHKKGTCNPYELPINIPMPTGLPAWWKRSTPTTAPSPISGRMLSVVMPAALRYICFTST